MIIAKIKNILEQTLKALGHEVNDINVERTNNIRFGDFSSNVALALSKQLKQNPMVLAKEIVNKIPVKAFLKVDVTPPGFINFYVSNADHKELLDAMHNEGNDFPVFAATNKKINVEFVSANPTGYLHLGHARNAVLGDIISKLYLKTGNEVITEYYINDAGNQMEKLASSVLVRYKQLLGEDVSLPDDSYHGEEIKIVAQALYDKYGDQFKDLVWNENFDITDKQKGHIIRKFAGDMLLDQIKSDLAQLGVFIEIYFSETKIHEENLIPQALEKLKDYTYTKDGALWFKATAFGDDKDRVLIKSDGVPTYFAPDIAYHIIKLTRDKGVDHLVDIWGADHASYVHRMQMALKAAGFDNKLTVVCIQLVRLLKDGKEFKLSKRTGQSITLLELVETISKDSTRWFMASASPNSHVEINIDTALKKDNNNPIYYVQYAHARATTLLSKMDTLDFNTDFSLLTDDKERELINLLHMYRSTIVSALKTYEPNKITNYLLNLVKLFHNYYTNTKVNNPDDLALSNQRAVLVWMVRLVIANALRLLGIDPVDQM